VKRRAKRRKQKKKSRRVAVGGGGGNGGRKLKSKKGLGLTGERKRGHQKNKKKAVDLIARARQTGRGSCTGDCAANGASQKKRDKRTRKKNWRHLAWKGGEIIQRKKEKKKVMVAAGECHP